MNRRTPKLSPTQQVRFAHFYASELVRDLTALKDQDAIGVSHDEFWLGRCEHDGRSGFLEFGDEPHHFVFRADVHAACRLFEHQHFHWAEQPLREHDFLLIATRQISRQQFWPSRSAADLLQQRLHDGMFAATMQPFAH